MTPLARAGQSREVTECSGGGAETRNSEGGPLRFASVGFVAWIVVGLLAGSLASRVTGTRRLGCLGTTLVGVVGGLLGGMLFNAAGDRGIGHFGLRSVLVAFVGASLLLLVTGLGARRRH